MAELPEDLDKYPVAEGDDLAGRVPVIDVGALQEGTTSVAAAAAVNAIAEACRDWGFFQVVNHGVQHDLVAAARRQAAAFFAAPQAVRDAVMRTRDNPWGYYNNELTKNQRDKKEVFDYTTDGQDPIYGACNRWPKLPVEFRDTLCTYRDAVARLGRVLLDAFCAGLGLPPDTLRTVFGDNHTGFVRLNYYPVRDPLATSELAHLPVADLGVHHHTDAGALTVLLQDEVGGLQVFREGRWYDVRPQPGAFVINTGDMMQVWSNDIYQAAVHRVLAMQAADRYSIPFFFNPAADAVVRPMPGLVTKTRPARYRPVSWAEFRGRRTDGDYADYGPEVQIAQFRT